MSPTQDIAGTHPCAGVANVWNNRIITARQSRSGRKIEQIIQKG